MACCDVTLPPAVHCTDLSRDTKMSNSDTSAKFAEVSSHPNGHYWKATFPCSETVIHAIDIGNWPTSGNVMQYNI